jgi:hypothetical protein
MLTTSSTQKSQTQFINKVRECCKDIEILSEKK